MSYKVCIGLATNGNNNQIENWINEINAELMLLDNKKYNCKVVICLNGRIRSNLEKKYNNLVWLYQKESGKNDALNKILTFARNYGFDIIHFLDDDIKFVRGSLKADLDSLTNTSINSHVLVGSNFYADVTHCSLIQKILCTPFTPKADVNLFLSGNSICSWLQVYPDMPPSETQIADDSYACVYFAEKYKDCKIVKPKKSIVYYEPAEGLHDWFDQQVRTYVGVEKSFMVCPEDYLKLEHFFAWRYAENPSYRKKIMSISKKEIFQLYIFRLFQRFVFLRGNYILRKNKKVAWNKFRGEY